MFFDTQISIRNRLGYVSIEYAASCIGYARIEDAKPVRTHSAFSFSLGAKPNKF